MKRAAEIIHLLPENRKKYLEKYTNPSTEAARILWQAGIRKQFYYEFGDEILRTYEYTGKQFQVDMKRILQAKETTDFFLQRRRKDVPEKERAATEWWAPLKWYGASLMAEPQSEEDEMSNKEAYHRMASGEMSEEDEDMEVFHFIYDEDDWSESIHM